MPPRSLSLAIVVFWVVTSGWFVYREIRPRLLPAGAPPFVIDLFEEVQRQRQYTFWTVYHNDKKVGRASTAVSYREAEDAFELSSVIEKLDLGGAGWGRMENYYRVTRNGELQGMTASVAIRYQGREFKFDITGEVRDNQFISQGSATLLGDLSLPAVPYSGRGSILNPMHPVNRIKDLMPGQRWRMPVVDPLADALAAKISSWGGIDQVLDAEVMAEPQALLWKGQKELCLVVQYEGQDLHARTWVRQSDGLVLRQEAKRQDDRWALERQERQ